MMIFAVIYAALITAVVGITMGICAQSSNYRVLATVLSFLGMALLTYACLGPTGANQFIWQVPTINFIAGVLAFLAGWHLPKVKEAFVSFKQILLFPKKEK
jgi:hypothetical protein